MRRASVVVVASAVVLAACGDGANPMACANVRAGATTPQPVYGVCVLDRGAQACDPTVRNAAQSGQAAACTVPPSTDTLGLCTWRCASLSDCVAVTGAAAVCGDGVCAHQCVVDADCESPLVCVVAADRTHYCAPPRCS